MTGSLVPERLRRVTLVVGAVAAFGIAEQHRHPAPLIAEIPGAGWPNGCCNVWSVGFVAAGFLCVAAAVTWPRAIPLRVAAVVLAGLLWARAMALFMTYGADLWGTVVQIVLTSLLVISSWSWTGETLRRLDPDR